MPRSAPRSLIRRSVVLAGVPLMLGACTRWRPSPAPILAQEHALRSPVRVTRRDGAAFVLDSAAVRGDSIVGFRQGAVEQHVSVALGDVATVEQRQVDAAGTALATAGAVLAGFGAYVLFALESMRTSGS